MSGGEKLEKAERIARRGTSALTFMIIKKRIPGQTLREALGDLHEACVIIETMLPPGAAGDRVEPSDKGE